jgi:hypothetical protein
LPFIFNQRISTGNITVMRQQVSTIPASSPYEISIAGLTLNQTNVRCTLIDNSTGDTYMTRVADTPGAGATGQFHVVAGKVVFHSSDAGKSVLITYDKAETGLTYIGGPAAVATAGTLQFFGKMAFSDAPTDIWSIWCKEVVKNDGFEFGSDTDNTTFSYSLNTPSDWNLPFLIYKN